MSQPLIDSLRRALAANPDDLPLRLHLAELLLEAGDRSGAVSELATVLAGEPGNPTALKLMGRALAVDARQSEPAAAGGDVAPEQPAEGTAAAPAALLNFDWTAAEEQLGVDVPPMFVGSAEAAGEPAFDLERPRLQLADVGGMAQAKQRLQASFLAPLRNPELRRMYSKSLRGGLLMYGPPGCGKTYLARALAGELQAGFLSVQITDILDPLLGTSERNVHELFQAARRAAPCVLFFDEVDALGQRRSQTRNSALRGTVNQLLTELDGVEQDNDGVFVLAATNQPWDVDPALRRPGRFDRTVLVLPPDQPAREAILRHHLQHRPIAGIDTGRLAKRTEGFSGADLAYVTELAAENALLASVADGEPRPIGMADLEAAVAGVRPSIGPWLETARNLVSFGEDDGTYGELRSYLKKAGRL
ncbi:ATP-binding protein [Jatrophihabitans sp.]|uniref:ATP-binding protein n=1 Tax=Jatrophihabitans sp. TaxID=1932789 RepID=UPI002BA95412|nr:ATP-binding protein [Jatrophihabitans sp.]